MDPIIKTLEPLSIIEKNNGLIEVVILVPPSFNTHQDKLSKTTPPKHNHSNPSEPMESFNEI